MIDLSKIDKDHIPTEKELGVLWDYMTPYEKGQFRKILKAMPVQRKELEFRGVNAEIQKYVDAPRPAEVLLESAAECLGGETRIYNPITRKHVPISELYQNKTAPMVQTLYGAAQAEVPFIKGTARLYRINLSDGNSFVATEGHRVLTQMGWVYVCDLSCGEVLQGYSQLTVSSIQYERTDVYYDLTVPEYHHYLAEGVWHHNTGKTFACLNLLDKLMRKYPKARSAMIRQYHVDMRSTVLEIFKREFVNTVNDISIFGGEDVEFFHYKQNGSRIWVAGMDRPGSILSGGLDVVYINEVRELKQESYEILTTRTTGRSGAIVPGLVFGDFNPAPYTHWIYAREAAGKVKILQGSHKDNPKLWDIEKGEWTPQGVEALTRLSNLTGALRAQLFEGKRVGVSGLVYGDVWDETGGSVTEDAEYIPDGGETFLLCDDGYSAGSAVQTDGKDPHTGFYVADSHPRVFLWAQLKSDGHLDIFQESYACKKLTDEHIREVLAMPYPHPSFASYGPGAAEFRGRLFAAEIIPHQCTERVETSIQEMRSWLAPDKNGFRRYRVHPRCKQLRAEMVSYAYDPQTMKPIKAFDHGCDATRGGIWVLRGLHE